MRTKITALNLVLLIMAIVSCKQNQSAEQPIFPKGEKIANDNFTGIAFLHQLVLADSMSSIQVGNVSFEPGARTKWHSHPGGQILLATNGVGYYQERGQLKRILRKGDVVKCAKDIVHWHGASKDSAFVQLAITDRQHGAPIWLEKVDDKTFNE